MSAFEVLPNDYGIRPAGKPDACFYCRQRVGLPHLDNCECLVVDVKYDVWYEDMKIGSWSTDEPAFWSRADGEFHTNESSWCRSNILECGNLDVSLTNRARLSAASDAPCLCSIVSLKETSRGTDVRRAS